MTRFHPSANPSRPAAAARCTPGQAGFSLVELLTATGLAGLVLMVLMALLDSSLRIYQRGSGNLQSYSEARYALSRTTDELGAAVILQPTDPQPEADQPMPKPANLALVQNHSSLEGLPGVVFVQQRRNAGAGDLIITAYRYDAGRFVIERAEINSDSLWQNNRDYSFDSIAPNSWDWRPLCQGVTQFDLAFFTRSDLLSANPAQTPTHPSWDTRNHGRPAQGRLALNVIDPTSLSVLAEVGVESTVGQRLIDEKTTTLSRDIRF